MKVYSILCVVAMGLCLSSQGLRCSEAASEAPADAHVEEAIEADSVFYPFDPETGMYHTNLVDFRMPQEDDYTRSIFVSKLGGLVTTLVRHPGILVESSGGLIPDTTFTDIKNEIDRLKKLQRENQGWSMRVAGLGLNTQVDTSYLMLLISRAVNEVEAAGKEDRLEKQERYWKERNAIEDNEMEMEKEK